jgi:hypothetical protein
MPRDTQHRPDTENNRVGIPVARRRAPTSPRPVTESVRDSHLVVAVFIGCARPTRDSAIARVAKLAYDCWSH